MLSRARATLTPRESGRSRDRVYGCRPSLAVVLAMAMGCHARERSGAGVAPSASSADVPAPVDGSKSLREVFASAASVHVRELAAAEPAIRPRRRDRVLRDAPDVDAALAAIGIEQRPDASACPAFATPASSQCAAISIRDVNELRTILDRATPAADKPR
jgi:hypothetical protein